MGKLQLLQSTAFFGIMFYNFKNISQPPTPVVRGRLRLAPNVFWNLLP